MIKSGEFWEYEGCIHVHTTDSDGTKTVEEVADIAASVNIDFILVTDHMTLKSRFAGKEGYHKNTLVLIGYEHNDIEDCNHYLLFETKDVFPADMKPQDYVGEGKKQGALGIIAHPDEIRPRVGKHPSYPWLAWDAEGFDAIEIWNQMSEWMENLKPYNQIKMLFTPRRFMRSPTQRILQKWDGLNRIRKVAGIAAIDVHGFPYKIGPLHVSIFPYKVQFQSLRTHLLLNEELSRDINIAKKQVYDAIRDCRLFVSNSRWGNATGFRFFARRESVTVVSGGILESYKDAIITVRSPVAADMRLILDGEEIMQIEGESIEYRPTKGGLYRVEIYRKTKGWIFSNHIRIGG